MIAPSQRRAQDGSSFAGVRAGFFCEGSADWFGVVAAAFRGGA